MVPSFKSTASIFPEISFIQYFPLFSCKQYDVITDLILHNRKTSISLKRKKDISKRKTPFFCIFKGLSNKHKKYLSAYFINHCLAVLCKFLGDFWAFWERDIFFSKDRLN